MPSNSVGKIQLLSGSPDTFPHVAVGTVSNYLHGSGTG